MVRLLISDAFNTGIVDALCFRTNQNVVKCFFETSFFVYVHAYCFVCGITAFRLFLFLFFSFSPIPQCNAVPMMHLCLLLPVC